MQITAEMVTEAETEVAEAEQARTTAEEALMESPNSSVKAAELTAALKRVAQCRANARELREVFDARVAAEQAAGTREKREQAAGVQIAAAGKEMKAARSKLEDAAEVAQRALVALMVAAEAYDGQVVRHAGALEAAGLGLDGATGGASGLFATTVRVRGVAYESLAPAGALLWVADRVAQARLAPMSSVRASLAGLLGYRVWEQRGDDLMSGVSELAVVKHPQPPRVVNSFQAMQASK
jgi:colicin import membrane protein